MKRLLTILALFTFGAFASYAQCNNPFYTLEEGRHFEMANYNGKDKLQATVLYTITDVSETGGGYEATLNTKTLDKKDKELAAGDMIVRCDDGLLKMDIQHMLNGMKQLQTTEGMEVDIQGDHLIIPASLSVGDVLPESTTTVTMKMADTNVGMSTMDFAIKNRTVAGQEEMTTPAGTFSCYKITYDMDMNVKVMGMGRTTNLTGTEWIAEGVGMVRNEQYDKNGKLNSYSVLTKLE